MTKSEFENFVWPPNVIPVWFDPHVWDAIYNCYKQGYSIEHLARQMNTHESFLAVVIRRKRMKIFGKPR